MQFRPEVDYYELLQVHPRASPEMIKKAYRTLMGEMGAHPDLGGDEERAKLLNEAYAVLGDPDVRRAYDRAHWRTPWGVRGRPASRYPSGDGGSASADLQGMADFITKVLFSIIIVVLALMIARLLKNPVLDLADLIAMLLMLFRVWGRTAALPR